MINRLFKNKDVKVIILEVFLIVLGLVGLTLGVKYIMNSINVNVDTSKLAIDSMNANVTNGTLTPIEDSSVNINTTSNVLRITFDVKGASTNTGNNIIYDAILNIDADCSLKNESVKWNLYKNNNLLTSGSTSPKYDRDVLNGKITLTDIQQDLVKYSGSADKYVFILWMSESCTEEDITKCDISKGLTSDSGGKSIGGNIDIRLNSGKKKENKRKTMDIDACSIPRGNAAIAIASIDDGTTGDSGSGVYKVIHNAIPAESSATGSEIPAVTDYRYYGPNPNNYILLPDMNTVDNISCIVNRKKVENPYNNNPLSETDCESSDIYKFDYGDMGIRYYPSNLFKIVAPVGSMTWVEKAEMCIYGDYESGDYVEAYSEYNINDDLCSQLSVVEFENGVDKNSGKKTAGFLITKESEKAILKSTTNGLYRIIGSIYNELEKTNVLKVIKAIPLTDGTTNEFSWDYTSSGSYSNIWATVTSGNYSNSLSDGSTLMQLLNSGLWWNGTSGSYYDVATMAITVDFTNYKLSDKAKSYISTSRYYLGGYSTSKGVMTNQFYAYERGTLRYDTRRPLYWDGMVGLMYPSDFGYAAGNTCVTGTDPYNYDGGCKNKNWLWMINTSDYCQGYEWLMSPSSSLKGIVFNVEWFGCVNANYFINGSSVVRPVFYLSKDVVITGGTGTIDDPYTIGL